MPIRIIVTGGTFDKEYNERTGQLYFKDTHMQDLRTAYRSRVEAMDEALHEHFADIADWTRPDGGYFMWLRLRNDSLDTAPMKNQALDAETGFTSGSLFSATGALRNYLRLSFAHYSEEDIREGIARLRPLFG